MTDSPAPDGFHETQIVCGCQAACWIQVYACDDCGALVSYPKDHAEWHERQDQKVRLASMGF